MSQKSTNPSIFLCATHRTGSNMLEQYMRASGVAGIPREYFSPKLAAKFAARRGLPDPRLDFRAYHAAVTETMRSANGVFSAKIMFRHLEALKDLTGKNAPELLQELHPGFQAVHISRQDKVKQAISMVRAKQSGVYTTVHLDNGQKQAAEPAEAEYSFEHIHHYVLKFRAEDAGWERLFAEYGWQPHRVIFEEFTRDPQAHTERLLQALGLPLPQTWKWSKHLMRPQADPLSAEWYARYHAEAPGKDLTQDFYRQQQHQQRKRLARQKTLLGRLMRRLTD